MASYIESIPARSFERAVAVAKSWLGVGDRGAVVTEEVARRMAEAMFREAGISIGNAPEAKFDISARMKCAGGAELSPYLESTGDPEELAAKAYLAMETARAPMEATPAGVGTIR